MFITLLPASVTASGISAPDYQTILSTITDYIQQIYGTDAYLEPDSKDGQMVALVALAIHDANNTAIQVYNSFSPSSCMTDALTRNVRINGISRKAATNSTVDVTLTGMAGTTIINGSVKDASGVIWNLPASMTINVSGSVKATATCANPGAVAAVAGSITKTNTPTRGWNAVSNASAATVGSAAETDAQLRIRQNQSVAIPALTPFDAVDGAIANVGEVTRHKLYKNDTGAVNSDGIPAHSIAAIVDGGDITDIAQTICGKKGQRVAIFGSTTVIVSDKYDNPHAISFSRSTDVPIYISITLKVFTGYKTQIGEQIKQAIADYINGLTIGDDVLLSRIYSPANLGVVSGSNSKYHDINALAIGKSVGLVGASNVIIALNESASCNKANIALTVTS